MRNTESSNSYWWLLCSFCRLSKYPPTIPSSRMNRVCKQVSIESPATVGMSKEYVFQYDVMVPDVPALGARVKVRRTFLCSFILFKFNFICSYLTGDVCWSLLPAEVCQCFQHFQYLLDGQWQWMHHQCLSSRTSGLFLLSRLWSSWSSRIYRWRGRPQLWS